MKLKEFLEQFRDLDPEMEILKQDYDNTDMVEEPEFPIYKTGYMVTHGKFMFYEDYPCDDKQTKVLILY